MSTAIRDAHEKNYTFTGAYSVDETPDEKCDEEKAEKIDGKRDKNNKKMFRIVENRN